MKKQAETERFADSGAAIYDFGDQFLVACPRCAGRAYVRAWETTFRLQCTQCHHVESQGHWYATWQLYVQRKCIECHAQLRHLQTSNTFREKLPIVCPECRTEHAYETVISKISEKDGLKCDPHFGCPLWLQTDFQGELFWAYNQEHLAYLKTFINAKLRERGIDPIKNIRKNASMVSRLPGFIKKAGNRASLLKLLESLEKK